MSGCANKVILIGRLGQDIELKYTQGGTAVANISLATERRVKSGDKWEEKTVWIRLVVWGRRAETAQQYLSKGSKIYVEGELDLNEWEDRNGNKRQTIQVQVSNLVFLDSKGGSRGGGGSQGSGGEYEDRDTGGPDDFTDDQIPF